MDYSKDKVEKEGKLGVYKIQCKVVTNVIGLTKRNNGVRFKEHLRKIQIMKLRNLL